jgi:hypothetical protein
MSAPERISNARQTVRDVRKVPPDRKKADRAMQAMMKMQKIVIADLDQGFVG